MKKIALTLTTLMFTLTGVGELAAATPPANMPAPATQMQHNAGEFTGDVVETMDSAGYTYVLINTGTEKVWAAATQTSVKVGQKVSVSNGQLMTNFSSKTLNRTFDKIYFVPGIYPAGAIPKSSSPHGAKMASAVAKHPTDGSGRTVAPDAHVKPVTKAKGGYTVEEIISQSSALKGKTVKVRGRVVKFHGHIMGTNWMHIQDGTSGDLTVTTDLKANKGDIVLVEGPLEVNKDIGGGYKYPALIEKAKVTKE